MFQPAEPVAIISQSSEEQKEKKPYKPKPREIFKMKKKKK